MRHYDIVAWADLVRGVTPEPLRGQMERHLAGGCDRCRAASDAARLVARDAAKEYAAAAPDYAVRSVRAYFALRHPQTQSWKETLRLGVVFDSLLAPSAVGTRVLHDSSRQLLLQSEEFALDVRIDRPGDSRQSVVVGQLLERLGEPVVHVPTYLVSRGEIASTGFTGEFGSFHMEAEVERPVELWLFPNREQRIAVTLEASDASTSGDHLN